MLYREDLGSAIAYIEQGIDNAATNMAWMQNNFVGVRQWLSDERGAGSGAARTGAELSAVLVSLAAAICALSAVAY